MDGKILVYSKNPTLNEKLWLYIVWSNLKQWMCVRVSLHGTFNLVVRMQLSALTGRFDLKENGDSSVGRVADWKARRNNNNNNNNNR